MPLSRGHGRNGAVTRPDRIDFRLLRGPVPHVVEYFQLTAEPDGTTRVE
jgi:hypothetical protein